jgi:hypothetical protein
MGSPQERPNGAHVPPGLSFVLGRLESSSTARVAAGAFGFLILIQVFDGQINSPVFEERFCDGGHSREICLPWILSKDI